MQGRAATVGIRSKKEKRLPRCQPPANPGERSRRATRGGQGGAAPRWSRAAHLTPGSGDRAARRSLGWRAVAGRGERVVFRFCARGFARACSRLALATCSWPTSDVDGSRRWGAMRARVTGPTPRTRYNTSSSEENARSLRAAINWPTSVGPTWGKAPRTWGGAVFGSTTSSGATTIVARADDCSPEPADASPSAAKITVPASTPRVAAGQDHGATWQRGAGTGCDGSGLGPVMLDIRFVSLDLACR
jgi:hypothetical protein